MSLWTLLAGPVLAGMTDAYKLVAALLVVIVLWIVWEWRNNR
jgi:hypothetical protein